LPLLALNRSGHFERIESGVTTPLAARGAAFGDINNDGYMDVLLTTLGGPPVLLLNRGGGANHWLGITLRGMRSNRDGYGARVSVNGQTRFATSAGSYICANDKRLHFGLGSAQKATVEVVWPSGKKQILNDVHSDQFLEIKEPEA
jgi:enediyne biosynthesis protein E4